MVTISMVTIFMVTISMAPHITAFLVVCVLIQGDIMMTSVAFHILIPPPPKNEASAFIEVGIQIRVPNTLNEEATLFARTSCHLSGCMYLSRAFQRRQLRIPAARGHREDDRWSEQMWGPGVEPQAGSGCGRLGFCGCRWLGGRYAGCRGWVGD